MSYGVPNCLVTRKMETGKCYLCNKGFFLSNDATLCEKLSVGQCNNYIFGDTVFMPNSALSNDFLYSEFLIAFYLNQFSPGCAQCSTDYVALQNPQMDSSQCVSSYLLAKKIDTYQFDFIPNCQIHNGQTKECEKCYENYIINRTKNQCFYGANLLFCLIAEDEDNCFQCFDGAFLSNNVCKQGIIENCLVYQNEEP